MTAESQSVMKHHEPSRYTLQLFAVRETSCGEEKSISLFQYWVMPNQHSPRRALFHFVFFSPHVRSHISISPCWVDISNFQNQFDTISITGDPLNLHQWSGFGKQLHQCRTLVIWRESALTSLDAVEEASPGEGGQDGRGAVKGQPAALQQKAWALMRSEMTEDPLLVTDTCKHGADLSKHTSRTSADVAEVSGPPSCCSSQQVR